MAQGLRQSVSRPGWPPVCESSLGGLPERAVGAGRDLVSVWLVKNMCGVVDRGIPRPS